MTRTERIAAATAAALITAGWLLCRLGHHLTTQGGTRA